MTRFLYDPSPVIGVSNEVKVRLQSPPMLFNNAINGPRNEKTQVSDKENRKPVSLATETS